MAKPTISVVLATYNRRPLLEKVLRAYQRQTLSGIDFELVVADDGSTDDTMELLSSWRPEEYSLRYLSQENAGQGRARNNALRLASGEIVLFTGDDIVPSATLLLRHLEAHRAARTSTSAFVGLSRWPDDIEVTSTMRHVTGIGAEQFSYHYFKDGAEYDFRHFYTSNISIRRRVLDLEAPCFSTAFPKYGFEDVELGYRLAFHGVRIYYLAAAQAFHYHHYSVRGFFARQVSCGEMGVVLYRKYPELAKWVRMPEIEWLGLRAALDQRLRRRCSAPTLDDLDECEERLITFASFYDRLYLPPLDDLLSVVFGYAYLKGLAEAALPATTADSARRFLFATRVAPAVDSFAARAAALGVFGPSADLQRISADGP